MKRAGFSLIEVMLIVSLFGLLLAITPGLEKKGLLRLADQDEVQRMVDLLRLAQRRAILTGTRQYLTVNPAREEYYLYELEGDTKKNQKVISLQRLDLAGINRTVTDMENTFYFTPLGTPVFGCTITLKDEWNLWRILIAVSTGKIRIEKE